MILSIDLTVLKKPNILQILFSIRFMKKTLSPNFARIRYFKPLCRKVKEFLVKNCNDDSFEISKYLKTH